MDEINYIRFPQDIAPTSNIERSDKIIIAKVNGDTFVTTIARLSKIVGESGQRVEPVAPGELPYLDTLSERFMEVDLEGDYYFEGILLANNPNGYKTLFWWDGDKWEFSSQYRVLGDKGDGVEDATINEDGDLIITYTDGVIVNAGHVKGDKGDPLPYSEWSPEDVDKLIQDVNVNAQRIPAITAGVLPTPPQANMYMVVTGVGAYTYGGATIGTNADGYQTTFWWNGTAWSNNGSVRVKGDMPTGTSVLIDNEVPSGLAVKDYVEPILNAFDIGKNKFNKLSVIEGSYINATTGDLLPNGTSAVSPIIPVEGNTMYYLSGRNSGQTEVRFFDASNNLLKPRNATTGAELSNFILGYQNGQVLSPVNAVGFQFTVKFNNIGTYDTIQFEKGSVATTYTPYELVVTEAIEAKEEANEAILLAESLKESLDNFTDGDLSVRLNKGESTNNPEYFKESSGASNYVTITIEEDSSLPFYELLPYKRKMRYELTNTPSSIVAVQKINLGTDRPDKLTISYWIKESILDTFFKMPNTLMPTFLSTGVFQIDINNLLLNKGVKQTITVTPSVTEYNSATLTAWVNNTIDGYVQIVHEFDIDWKLGFTGTGIDYYYIFTTVQDKIKNNFFEVYNYTVIYGEINTNTIVYADPEGLFGQKPIILKSIENQLSTLNNRIDSISGGQAQSQIVGEELFFATSFDDTKNLVRVINVKRDGSFTNNGNVNFSRIIVNTKGLPLNVGAVLKNEVDDIAPNNINFSYIAGNHGWAYARVLTLNSHGKTFADVGSKWKDSTDKTFTILRIVDANNLWICSDNYDVTGYGYSFASPSGTLTYVSNGSNTSSMSGYTIAVLGNLYNTLIENKRKVLINGTEELTGSDVVDCSFVDIVEDYDILDLPSVLANLTANRPSGGYTSNPQLNAVGGDKLFNHNITYRLLGDGTTLVIHSFYTYKKTRLNYLQFIQSGKLTTGNLYIPKVLPISDGVKNYDFTTIEDWNSSPAQLLRFTPAYWEEPTSPPDRFINFNADISLHGGILFDFGAGKLRRENPSTWLKSAFDLNAGSGKIYPMAIRRDGDFIEAGLYLSCVTFRSYSNPSLNPVGRLNMTQFEFNNKLYIYLDYNSSINDVVSIPSNYVGKTISVYEKTDNVDLLNSGFAMNSIRLNAAIDSVNVYGYCVLVLE